MSKAPEILVDSFSTNDSMSIQSLTGVLYAVQKDEYGRETLKEVNHNTITVGGCIETLKAITGITPVWQPKTLNQIYNTNADVSGSGVEKVALFGIGTGGSEMNFSSVVAKNDKSINIPDMIPLRTGESIIGDESDMYALKVANMDSTFNWMLKEFSSGSKVTALWKDSADAEVDGTEITDDISGSSRPEGVSVLAKFPIHLNVHDAREVFEKNGEIDMARYNTLGLYTGEKVKLEDDTYDYVNIRLFSYLNFRNKDLNSPTDSSYLYVIYLHRNAE